MTTVPKLWLGSTIVCIGTGPSLTQADVDACRDRARVIAVNDAYKYAPWADVLYAHDEKWWQWQIPQIGVLTFPALKYSLKAGGQRWFPDLQVLRNTGWTGLELDPTGLRTSRMSGYQAINLAVHFGAARIVLLGYDMRGTHFFGPHHDKTVPHFSEGFKHFPTLVEPLKAAGVAIVNCTRDTALTCFPRAPLDVTLAERAA